MCVAIAKGNVVTALSQGTWVAVIMWCRVVSWGMHGNNNDLITKMATYMMTSSNGNIFRVTGHLGAEFTGPRWILHTKASDAELWCFLWSAPNKRLSKQWWGWWFEMQWCPLWRHCNDLSLYRCVHFDHLYPSAWPQYKALMHWLMKSIEWL